MDEIITNCLSKKTTLTDIVFQVAEITNDIVESRGELTPEMEARLADIDLSLARKVDAYAGVIERLDMEVDYWDKKAREMKSIADSHKRLKEGLRTRIKDAMRTMGKNEILGQDVKFRLVRSQPRLVIRDEKNIPAEFQVVSWDVDKEKLKKALVSEMKVPGAELEESYSLRTFVRKD